MYLIWVILLQCTHNFQALHYLILISEVDDTEIFKICLEYWNALASDLYRESPFLPPTGASPLYLPRPNSRRQFYQPILTKVDSLYFLLK